MGCGSDEPDSPTPKPETEEPTPEPEQNKLETLKEGRLVIAYAPYYRSMLPNPDLVTNISYSFAEVYVRDGVYQTFKLQDPSFAQGSYNQTAAENRFREILALRSKNPNIKISLSFSHTVSNGDNYQDGGFSAIAATDENRKKFAQDCLDFLKKWNIDGIDLDWEFPGLSWSGAAFDPIHDVDNYTLLVKQLRETLGRQYLLTFAGYVMDKRTLNGSRTEDGSGWRYIDLKAVRPYVDYVNIMAYDIDSPEDGGRGFQSAVSSSTSWWDITRCLAEYREAGYDYSQLVLGIPFYMRHSFSGADGEPVAIDYRDLIVKAANDKTYKIDNWDSSAQTPYVTRNGQFWGSYDNEESIVKKGRRYIGGLGMKGMLYWDSGADDDRYTLSKACWNAVMKAY